MADATVQIDAVICHQQKQASRCASALAILSRHVTLRLACCISPSQNASAEGNHLCTLPHDGWCCCILLVDDVIYPMLARLHRSLLSQ